MDYNDFDVEINRICEVIGDWIPKGWEITVSFRKKETEIRLIHQLNDAVAVEKSVCDDDISFVEMVFLRLFYAMVSEGTLELDESFPNLIPHDNIKRLWTQAIESVH